MRHRGSMNSGKQSICVPTREVCWLNKWIVDEADESQGQSSLKKMKHF